MNESSPMEMLNIDHLTPCMTNYIVHDKPRRSYRRKVIISYRSKYGCTGTFTSNHIRRDTKWLKQGGYIFTVTKL